MSRFPPFPPVPSICGTAMASIDRMGRLRAVVAELDITARAVPGGVRVTLRVRDAVSDAVATCLPMEVNVHNAKHTASGYPFLGSSLGVRLEGPGATVEVELEGKPAGLGTAAIVLQTADAFEGRSVRLDG
jgi:hypothetical protein